MDTDPKFTITPRKFKKNEVCELTINQVQGSLDLENCEVAITYHQEEPLVQVQVNVSSTGGTSVGKPWTVAGPHKVILDQSKPPKHIGICITVTPQHEQDPKPGRPGSTGKLTGTISPKTKGGLEPETRGFKIDEVKISIE